MRCLLALALVAGLIGCAKKDDPVPPAPSATPSTSVSNQGGSGTPVAGTPYVPGAGGVSPVSGGDLGEGGGGVGQAALGKARGIAGKMSQPAAPAPDSSGDSN